MYLNFWVIGKCANHFEPPIGGASFNNYQLPGRKECKCFSVNNNKIIFKEHNDKNRRKMIT